jgi:tight adherence protein B
VDALTPFAVIILGIATAIFLFVSFWSSLARRIERFGNGFSGDMEITGMTIPPARFGFIVVGSGMALWVVALVLLAPPLILGVALFVLFEGGALFAARAYVQGRKASRIAKFQDQLETSLRTIAGGLRVGLGVQQAIVMVGERSREPARHEFTRLVGLTNLGMSIFDAFDQLAVRMNIPETGMLARVIRVQAQSGGDLASVLDNLADTIRDRRRLKRRVSAITSQGRATGWLLGFIPIGVGLFLVVAEPQLRDASLHTLLGQVFLAASLGLDGLAIFTLMQITKLDA